MGVERRAGGLLDADREGSEVKHPPMPAERAWGTGGT